MLDTTTLPDKAPEYDLQALFDAGVHFGHQSRKWHPKMKPWIYMEKDGVHIFDLAKTAAQLRSAYNYLFELGRKGKTVIFVGTKKQARDVIREEVLEGSFLTITSRWLGGLLTNWSQVSKSLKRMVDIEEGLTTGKFDGYTKFERVQLEKEKNRLFRFFDGLRGLKGIPDCVVVIDPKREKNALIEARSLNIPVVGIVDTNADPTDLDLVVPGNDDGYSSIKLLTHELMSAYAAGKAEAGKAK